MIIQPYIENAIKHGLLHQKGLKILTIHFKLHPKYLTCTINDNGIGRKASQEINARRAKYHKSFASKANEQRIDLINAVSAKKIQIQILDQHPGTQVILHFPLTENM